MFAVRIHGFGGQGVLTIAELLTIAAVTEGRYGQASMAGGPEHIGHPTVACCRIDDDPLPGWEPVVFPDAVIVRDAALLHVSDVFHGLGADGFILLDSARDLDDFGLPRLTRYRPERTISMPASEIAQRELGHPLPNTALLGGFAALTGIVSIIAVETAIRERFAGRLADDGIEAARDAFAFVRYTERRRAGLLPVAQAQE